MSEKHLPDLVQVTLDDIARYVLEGKIYSTPLEIVEPLSEEILEGVDLVTFTALHSKMGAVIETIAESKTATFVELIDISKYKHPINPDLAKYQLCFDINKARLTNLEALRSFKAESATSAKLNNEEPVDIFTLNTEGTINSSILYDNDGLMEGWCYQGSDSLLTYVCRSGSSQHQISFKYVDSDKLNSKVYTFKVHYSERSYEYYAVIAEFMYYCELLMVRVYGSKNFHISDEYLHLIYDWLLVNCVPLSDLMAVLYETITMFHTYGDNFTGVPIQKELTLHILQQWNKFLTGDEVISPCEKCQETD